VIIDTRQSKTTTVGVSINAGSVNEKKNTSGSSHFVEHMLFEGTEKRPSAREITNSIEKLGGFINGGTSKERTVFACKVLREDVEVALDVLSDMLFHSLFKEDAVERQRRVILSEISLEKDEPRQHMWTLLQGSLFFRHPLGKPTYGSEACVKEMSREDLLDYHSRFYRAGNMTLTLVGDVPDALSRVEDYFSGIPGGPAVKKGNPKFGGLGKKMVLDERKNLLQSYRILGFRAPPRKSAESFAFDLIDAVLGRGQSGRIFDEVRNKRGLAYDVGVGYESEGEYGFFGIYACTEKEDEEEAMQVITDETKKVGNMSIKDLEEAKKFIIGDYTIKNEEPLHWTDTLCFLNDIGKIEYALDYPSIISSVTKEDVKSTAEEYLEEKKSVQVAIRGKNG
jgi:predicted Zn-dependent peptidase